MYCLQWLAATVLSHISEMGHGARVELWGTIQLLHTMLFLKLEIPQFQSSQAVYLDRYASYILDIC